MKPLPSAPFLALALLFSCAGPSAAADRPDLVVADFEGDDYGGWKSEGTAFGDRPARGALPGQMEVAGFRGKGLANSFHGGDPAQGTLTSPPFRVERAYLNFLIGGGKHAGLTCLDLVVAGKAVRTASGPNDRPGGSERLDWASWDVRDLDGQEAVLRVVDHSASGWGHVSVDQVEQSDRRHGLAPASRTFGPVGRYLLLPVRQDAPVRRVKVEAGGKPVDEFDIKLAEGPPEFYAVADLARFPAVPVRVEAVLPADSRAMNALLLSNDLPDARTYPHETHRPRFHFTARRGWLNDPNGLVWFAGEYHLFFQHNPFGWDWGNMHWGHAVSRDLVHWAELPEALAPRAYGDWCFSGSAVVDQTNSSGFAPPKAKAPPLVGAYTSTGRGECIIYSNDRGRTWTEFAGNPVLKHEGRDPRLLWHAPTKRWVMAVYDETGGRRAISFHSSADLKAWRHESDIDGYFECPDLFELPVEGKTGQSRWVLSAADGEYALGTFDGRKFTPDSPGKQRLWYGDFYAAQTFSDAPGGRRIQIGWGRDITFPAMPFNQQMAFPCDLALRETADGPRLCARPVKELDALVTITYDRAEAARKAEGRAVFPVGSESFRVRAEAEVGLEGTLRIDLRGVPVTYDARTRTLACGKVKAPLDLQGRPLKLTALVDRGSVEVFADDGRVAVSLGSLAKEGEAPTVRAEVTGAGAAIRALAIDVLEATWD